MNNAIYGFPFDAEVKKQIEMRQQKMFAPPFALADNKIADYKSPEIIKFQNTTAWVRLASAINVDNTITTTEAGSSESAAAFNKQANDIIANLGLGVGGSSLAKKTVLSGGIVDFTSGKNLVALEGFLGEYGQIWTQGVYGFGKTTFGYKPSPYVESINVKYLNDGALQEANIRIKCFTVDQLDILDLVYLKPGFTFLLEWGHTNYFDNKGNYQSVFDQPILTDPFELFFKEGVTSETLDDAIKIQQQKASYNYDAFHGVVTNFTYTFNKDGSYDINIKAYSEGSVIESLKLNSAGGDYLEKLEDAQNKSQYPANSLTSYLQNIQQESGIISVREYTDAKTKQVKKTVVNNPVWKNNTEGFLELKPVSKGKTYDDILPNPVLSEEVDIYAINFTSPPQPNTVQIVPFYISFAALLQVLNNNFSIYGKEGTDIRLQFNTGSIMFWTPGMLSADPMVCVTPIEQLYTISFPDNEPKLNPLPMIDEYVVQGEPSDWQRFYNPTSKLQEYFWLSTDQEKKFQLVENAKLANLGAVGINFDLIFEALNTNLDASTGRVPIISFLETILAKVAGALGGINKFRILVDSRVVTIVDEASYVGAKSDNLAYFATYGIGTGKKDATFLTDVAFQTTMTNEMASQIAIAAQANANRLGENATALSQFSRGLIDRTAPLKSLSSANYANNSVDKQERISEQKRTKTLFQNLYDNYFTNVYSSAPSPYQGSRYGGVGLDPAAIKQLYEANIDYANFLIGVESYGNEEYATPFFFPFELTLEMIGLSGMRILEKFAVEDRIFPYYYRGKFSFIVFDLEHTVEKNQWRTKVRAYTVPETNLKKSNKSTKQKKQEPNIIGTSTAPSEGINIIRGLGLNVTNIVLAEAKKWGITNTNLNGVNSTYGKNESDSLNILQTYSKNLPDNRRIGASSFQKDALPWSAAFISYVMKQADPTFFADPSHINYFNYYGEKGHLGKKGTNYKTYNITNTVNASTQIEIQVGDLLWFQRGATEDQSHSDVVYKIDKENGIIYLAGGNVANTATLGKLQLGTTYIDSRNKNLLFVFHDKKKKYTRILKKIS